MKLENSFLDKKAIIDKNIIYVKILDIYNSIVDNVLVVYNSIRDRL
jgi:hypothetical protein